MNVSVIRQKVMKAKDLIGNLKKVALDDGEITEEERVLIVNIGKNLENYFSIVKNAEGDVLSQNEELHIMEKRILQDAHATALSDGMMSDNEKSLLAELIKIMQEISELRE